MREISSKDYAELVSKTDAAQACAGNTDETLDKAYRAGVIHATKYFMDMYKAARDNYYGKIDGMSFEALDFLFQSCAGSLIGEAGIDE